MFLALYSLSLRVFFLASGKMFCVLRMLTCLPPPHRVSEMAFRFPTVVISMAAMLPCARCAPNRPTPCQLDRSSALERDTTSAPFSFLFLFLLQRALLVVVRWSQLILTLWLQLEAWTPFDLGVARSAPAPFRLLVLVGSLAAYILVRYFGRYQGSNAILRWNAGYVRTADYDPDHKPPPALASKLCRYLPFARWAGTDVTRQMNMASGMQKTEHAHSVQPFNRPCGSSCQFCSFLPTCSKSIKAFGPATL